MKDYNRFVTYLWEQIRVLNLNVAEFNTPITYNL